MRLAFVLRMRSAALLILASTLICAGAAAIAEDLGGRWEGSIKIPGDEVELIVDLAPSGASGGKEWTGSIIIPGLGVKGAQLSALAVGDQKFSCTIDGALGNERTGKARLDGHLADGGQLAGSFSQAGHSAPFELRKTGRAQVELPRQSTPVSKGLEGVWKGDYEMLGYPRHVTLTLSNPVSDHAAGQFVIVGKRTTNVPLDLVLEEFGRLTVEAYDFGLTFEGRLRKDRPEIEGTFTLGPTEVPLVLQRTP
jgi:hypothetical protein